MLQTLVSRDGEFLPARLTLAEYLLDAGQSAEALEHVQFVLERVSDDARTRHLEGLVLEALGRTDEALASFQKAVDCDVENEVYRLSFQTAAQTIASRGDSVERARWIARPAPQDVTATLAAASSALHRNDTEESLQLLTAALPHAPNDVRLLRALGACHYRRGECGEAQVVLAKAVSLDSSDPLSYFLLGATLRQMGQTADAERHLATAAKLDPRYATWR
jgi:Flp pilus assembly protein TadD